MSCVNKELTFPAWVPTHWGCLFHLKASQSGTAEGTSRELGSFQPLLSFIHYCFKAKSTKEENFPWKWNKQKFSKCQKSWWAGWDSPPPTSCSLTGSTGDRWFPVWGQLGWLGTEIHTGNFSCCWAQCPFLPNNFPMFFSNFLNYLNINKDFKCYLKYFCF